MRLAYRFRGILFHFTTVRPILKQIFSLENEECCAKYFYHYQACQVKAILARVI